ncbi:MAG: ATP-binding protein [Deltaproteobacteria bacterium]|nr:ATP-binding protein [Deltaproteobacteria bacterium]
MDWNKFKSNGYYRSLTRNIFLTIFIVSIMPMVLVSGIILYQFQTSYHEKVNAHLEELVLKHKQNIDIFLKEKLSDIRFLGEAFNFTQLKDESVLQEILRNLQQEYGPVFVDLGVINSYGLQVAYAGPFKLGMALYATADWFQSAMQTDYFISDVFLGLRGLPHFIITVRKNWMGEQWILRATIDFVAFNNLVENIRIGETGFAFILNREGKFQTTQLLDIMPAKEPYMEFLKKGQGSIDRIHIVEKTGGSGNKNIYVAAFLKEGDWLLVYQQRSRDAFSDFEKALIVTLAIILSGGLGIITTAFILSRKMVDRVVSADQEKEMMNEQIIESGKLASVGELAAGIAHEINNPVAIMVEEAGWIGDLLEEEEFQQGKNLDEFQRALNQIRAQGRRCKEITQKLLSFARKTDSRVQEVNANELIDEIVALSAQRAKYSNVTIETDLQNDLPALHMSQTELQQVLLNLINNALDAMEKQGGTINISSKTVDSSVMIEVTDDGPGIPEANLSRIFDPFFTTKPVGKGTGLGLSICYGIINKLGGQLEVRSTLNKGSVFCVRIPLPEKKDNNLEEPSADSR